MRSVFIGAILFSIVHFSCSKADKSKQPVSNCPDSTGTISYSQQITPIIHASCGDGNVSCHGPGSNYGDFTSYQGFISHPADHIIHCVKQDNTSAFPPMPWAGGKLSACNIAKIVIWVNQGEKNN